MVQIQYDVLPIHDNYSFNDQHQNFIRALPLIWKPKIKALHTNNACGLGIVFLLFLGHSIP